MKEKSGVKGLNNSGKSASRIYYTKFYRIYIYIYIYIYRERERERERESFACFCSCFPLFVHVPVLV